MPPELAIEEPLDLPAVVRGDPATLDQKVSQRLILDNGPTGARLSKLTGVDKVLLHCQDAEKEIAVGTRLDHCRLLRFSGPAPGRREHSCMWPFRWTRVLSSTAHSSSSPGRGGARRAEHAIVMKSSWRRPIIEDIVQAIGNRSVPGLPRSPQQRNAAVKRVSSSSLSLSSFTLIALAGFGFIVAGRAAARADDQAAAGTRPGPRLWRKPSRFTGTPSACRTSTGRPTPRACSASSMPRPKITSGKSKTAISARWAGPPRSTARSRCPTTWSTEHWRLPGSPKKNIKTASPKTKEICQAIADGLNYYLAVNPQVKPRLITHFEPWHPLAFRRFILYQSFIYGKSGLQASDILSAVQEIHDNKVGAVAFPADLRAELAAMEQDRQSMSEHVGSNMWAVRPEQVGIGQSAHVHQSAPAFLRPGTVV